MLALDERHPSDLLLDALASAGIRPRVVNVRGAGDLPDPAPARTAIVVGSDRFEDAERSGRVKAEIDWLQRADRCGTAVTAVGHGARLLAVAFGGRVMPAERALLGWALVDTQVPHLVPAGPWIAWQHDLIWPARHAEVLAYNRLGPQVFRVGRHLGVQFHPDATEQTLLAWTKPSDDPDHSLDPFSRDHDAATSSARRLFATLLNLRAAPDRPQDLRPALDGTARGGADYGSVQTGER